MRELICTGLVAIAMTGCADSATEAGDRFAHVEQNQAAAADEFGQLLLDTCENLAFVDRYKLVDATIVDAPTGYPSDTYGWDRYGEFEFVAVGGQDDGHHLLYRVGRGAMTGVLGQKPAARRACDLRSADAGADWFKPAEGAVASTH